MSAIATWLSSGAQSCYALDKSQTTRLRISARRTGRLYERVDKARTPTITPNTKSAIPAISSTLGARA